nr:immunoglobulin heavy chain junction region [Mus musculus]
CARSDITPVVALYWYFDVW